MTLARQRSSGLAPGAGPTLRLVPDLTLLDRRTPAIAVLTLNHPEHRNALSVAMRDEISDHLGQLSADDELKVVIIANAGPVFCAGFDLREFERAELEPGFARSMWASSDRYHHTVATFPMVTIAALGGPAIAGGFDLAILSDLRVAATTTTFSHPEYAFGDVVYGPLRDLVGGSLARDLCLTGRVLTASDALAANLVTAVVEPAEVLAHALALADRIAIAPRDALRRTKAKALDRSGIVRASGTLDL